jgi:hypothetical protein
VTGFNPFRDYLTGFSEFLVIPLPGRREYFDIPEFAEFVCATQGANEGLNGYVCSDLHNRFFSFCQKNSIKGSEILSPANNFYEVKPTVN